ncbi:rubrerythrin [Caldanaerobacter subterraneus subsp. tengcongensis MB4]|uniref:DUF1657 domain-containing protein n=1 Tax=Caldanaerobacter subterraneus TaxID=911092 RepID=UPI00216765E7|nr:DUF1657 domain-containing protein [Caldanaerobacter subterraneus]MCS3917164.1 rubrerythrin [Caldanaerobacter subterraneus subsp. tengcongensis MB4]
MTVKSDIEKAIASAQAALGTYEQFASATEDPAAKQMFQQMQQDMQRHVTMLTNRLNYLNSNNKLNQQSQPTQQATQQNQQNVLTNKKQ